MLYPSVTETKRVGEAPRKPFARSQRELVEMSLRMNPVRTTARPPVSRDARHGIFR